MKSGHIEGGILKRWIQKFVDQLGMDPKQNKEATKSSDGGKTIDTQHFSEERGTLLFLLDAYGKNLIETDHSSPRRVRETLDEFARALIEHDDEKIEKTLFNFRQFFFQPPHRRNHLRAKNFR
jgi:hypothetical protein